MRFTTLLFLLFSRILANQPDININCDWNHNHPNFDTSDPENPPQGCYLNILSKHANFFGFDVRCPDVHGSRFILISKYLGKPEDFILSTMNETNRGFTIEQGTGNKT